MRSRALGSSVLLLLIPLGVLAAAPEDPVAMLTQPGATGGFRFLRNADVQATPDGRILRTRVAPATGPEPGRDQLPSLKWSEPGVRVIESVAEVGGTECTVKTGAYLTEGREAGLWLFRLVELGTRRDAGSVTLNVDLEGDGLGEGASIEEGGRLVCGGRVQLLVARPPGDVSTSGASGVRLQYDMGPGADEPQDLLIAWPLHPPEVGRRDLLDIRSSATDHWFGEIAEWWRRRVMPEALTLGSPLVNDAYHAAVGTLILHQSSEQPSIADAASLVSALARAGLGYHGERLVSTWIGEQGEDGSFTPGGPDTDHARVIVALADVALYAQEPERWCRTLWRPIDRAAAYLAARELPSGDAALAALALTRAAAVARLIGETAPADDLIGRAEQLASGAELGLVASDPLAPRAAALLAGVDVGEPAPESAPVETLARARVAVLTGNRDARARAWQAVQSVLEGQALPGALVVDGQDDPTSAAHLVGLVADSVVRAEGDALHVLASVPAGWAGEQELVALGGFPSGLGPITLTALTHKGTDQVAVDIAELPRPARVLRLDAPLGAAFGGVRQRGRALGPEEVAEGPPWDLEAKGGRVLLVPEGVNAR